MNSIMYNKRRKQKKFQVAHNAQKQRLVNSGRAQQRTDMVENDSGGA